MEEKLYGYMDWAGIEALVYSEEDHPHQNLGAHLTEDGVLFQAFFPDAKEVYVSPAGKKEEIPMVMEDEGGYFAVLVPGKRIPKYTFHVIFKKGEEEILQDPYAFAAQLTRKDTEKFNEGISYEIYQKLGAHPKVVKGVEGVEFAVWAPNAVRVSVVGDFDHWDGRMCPMERLWDSGIFELFVPDVKAGDIYKYEIKAKGGLTYLKADPYAFASELRPDTASIVANLNGFAWTDEKWLKERPDRQREGQPMAVYEVDLCTFAQKEEKRSLSLDPKEADEPVFEVARSYYNYRELAPMIAKYVKEMGYTHIELLPVMEHFSDESLGYEVTGYYAPTARFGTPEDFMYFMNYMHEKGIGVILDWVPAQFPRDNHALAAFDGTFLYEHMDPRRGVHPKHNTLLYNYGRPEVSNFLIANALFWKNVYHADGLRLDSVATMLYLDYDRKPGEWLANQNGGRENLDAIEFFRHLNSVFKKAKDGAMMIAENAAIWPDMTAPVKEKGLGFDYQWNTGWIADTIGYMQLDPFFRSHHHEELTQGISYAFDEKFITGFSHDVIVNGQGSMYEKMPGKPNMKMANLRALYGYMMAYPGKKILFMGQDLGQHTEWNYTSVLPWAQFEEKTHKEMKAFMKALLALYGREPALYRKDGSSDGFEWVNNSLANEDMLVFLRKSGKAGEDLLIVCNFSPLVYEKHKVGVPYSGKYKEIFNSDKEEFGGSGNLNPRVKTSRKDFCDDMENSITITVPPMGISIFRCTKEPSGKK